MNLKLSKKATEAQPTNRFQELLEYLPLLRQGIYSTLTEAKPEEKGSLDNVLGVLGQYHQLKDGLNPEFSKQLGNDAAEKEIYAKTINFLMKYVEHRFKTTNNPGIWLSDSFLQEYDKVHATLQELSRRHSPTKAFPLVYKFLTKHDNLLEKCLVEVKPQIEQMDEKLFREVHNLTTISVLNDEADKVRNKLNEYRAFTNTYSLVLGETIDDFIDVERSVNEELEFYHRNPGLVEELRQKMGDPSQEQFPAKMERFLDSQRYAEGPLSAHLFVKYLMLLPEELRLIDEEEKQKPFKVERVQSLESSVA